MKRGLKGRPKSNIREQIELIIGHPVTTVFNDPRLCGRRLKFYGVKATEEQLTAIEKLPHVVGVQNWTPDGRSTYSREGYGGWEGLVVFIDTYCART